MNYILFYENKHTYVSIDNIVLNIWLIDILKIGF